MPLILLIFIAVPLIEIYFMIELGSVFGAGFTVFMIVLTAVIGAWLVRFQGFTTLARAQREIALSRMPAVEVIEGAILLIAGAMLLIPGFVTDTMGFLMLIPPLRQALVRRFLASRVMPANPYTDSGSAAPSDPRIIDVEHRDID